MFLLLALALLSTISYADAKPCAPSECGMSLTCYDELEYGKTNKTYCGPHMIPKADYVTFMTVDCDAKTADEHHLHLCEISKLWHDCKDSKGDNFKLRASCPEGTYMCEDRSCWMSPEECVTVKKSTQLYDNKTCKKPVESLPCSPEECGLGLTCYSEEDHTKTYCGENQIPIEHWNTFMTVDCDDETASKIHLKTCEMSKLWHDCQATDGNNFRLRAACPKGTYMCHDRSCWNTPEECVNVKKSYAKYNKNTCPLVTKRIDFKIGLMTPHDSLGKTDSLAALGREWWAAAEIFRKYINKNDKQYSEVSISGLLKMDTGDDKADVLNSLNAASSLDGTTGMLAQALKDFKKDQAVKAVIGGWRSSRSMPAAMQNAKIGMAQVSFGSTASALSDSQTYTSFFRTVPPDSYQAKAMVALLQKHGVTEVGLIGTTDAYAMGLARNFQAECDKAKIKVIPDINNMPSFTIHEKDSAVVEAAVGKLKSDGTSSFNFCAGVAGDCESVMLAAQKIGMVGKGWNWLGFDGMHASHLEGADKVKLRQLYQGVVATGIRASSGSLDTTIKDLWESLHRQSTPWVKTPKVREFGAFTAQLFDAMVIIAQAAQNFAVANTAATSITRAQLLAELKKSDLKTPSIGNIDKEGNFKFDRNFKEPSTNAQGGFDGFPTYEIQNFRGNSWTDIGDWLNVKTGDAIELTGDIVWPGGMTMFPNKARLAVTPDKQAEASAGWVVPLIIILSILMVCAFISMYYIYTLAKAGRFTVDIDQEADKGL